jgi:16S rRNA (guanine1207-N2)-methyltransferase
VGCGSGAIATSLALAGARVVAIDTDALALEATRETLRANGASADVRASDVYSEVPERGFDLIASNPPFHSGVRTTSEVAARAIAEAPRHLGPGGEMWVVANRFLDYAKAFEEHFGHVALVTEDSRYRVWRARK